MKILFVIAVQINIVLVVFMAMPQALVPLDIADLQNKTHPQWTYCNYSIEDKTCSLQMSIYCWIVSIVSLQSFRPACLCTFCYLRVSEPFYTYLSFLLHFTWKNSIDWQREEMEFRSTIRTDILLHNHAIKSVLLFGKIQNEGVKRIPNSSNFIDSIDEYNSLVICLTGILNSALIYLTAVVVSTKNY